MIEVEQFECLAGRGIVGDRFFDYQQDYKGQITFFSREAFESVCAAVQAPGALSPGLTRRNVIKRGIDLKDLVGTKFVIQGVEFEGACECKPCYWMDQAIAHGAEVAMRGRGGLRARILTSGQRCAGR